MPACVGVRIVVQYESTTKVASGGLCGEEQFMAFGVGSLVEIAVEGTVFAQQQMNVWTYRVQAYPGPASGAEIAEAFWQHVKAATRGVAVTLHTTLYQTVRVRELDDPLGLFGSYAVPTAEQSGTRSPAGSEDTPTFVALGARLHVGARTTRPGSKRFAGLCEADIIGQVASPTARAAVQALLDVACVPVTLGAPAALVGLSPVVVRRDPVTGLPVAWQYIESATANNYVTTQNTRKVGRGS